MSIVEVRKDDPTRGMLAVPCPEKGLCRFPVRRGPHDGGASWGWDGNAERPTVQPSIDCHAGCNRHFNVTNGEP